MEETRINKTDIKELRNLALAKKSSIKYRTLTSAIDGEYKVRLAGIGNQSIKLEIFLDYETILVNKMAGGLEETIYNKLMELPKPKLNSRLGKN